MDPVSTFGDKEDLWHCMLSTPMLSTPMSLHADVLQLLSTPMFFSSTLSLQLMLLLPSRCSSSSMLPTSTLSTCSKTQSKKHSQKHSKKRSKKHSNAKRTPRRGCNQHRCANCNLHAKKLRELQ